MLTLQAPLNVKLFFGILYSNNALYEELKQKIIIEFGEIDTESEEFDFSHTDYYIPEMGDGLKRRFISCLPLISAHNDFVNAKLRSVELENQFAKDNKRQLNIDPGYINEARMVLSSTKDFSHRVYLGKSIFAEITLLFAKNKFVEVPWTFPDYKTEKYKKYFINLRELYKKQLKALTRSH